MAHGPNLFAYVGDVMGVMGRGRRDKRNGLTGMRDHLHMSTSAIALEPRFMFDAAGVATAADAVTHDPTADALFDTADHSVDQRLLDAAAQATEADQKLATSTDAQPAPAIPVADAATIAEPEIARQTEQQVSVSSVGDSGRQEIVFIDTGIADWQILRDGIQPGVEIVLIDSATDGLTQISEVLENRTGLDAIHIISHGGEGKLFLGSGSIDDAGLSARSQDLAIIGRALSVDGDVLLYGCDIAKGADGLKFVSDLSALINADIAASDDSTGAANQGGDWTLESNSGAIESRIAVTDRAIDNYEDILGLVNGGTDGTVDWGTAASALNAGGITGRTASEVISAINILSSGFDVYAKNNSSSSSTSFTIRTNSGGMSGASGSFVRASTNGTLTPEWMDLRANFGIFDLSGIRVGSTDNTTATTYNFTIQALNSSFTPTGTAVSVSNVTKSVFSSIIDVSANTDFDGIYGVRITANAGAVIAVDDIAIVNARDPNPPTATITTAPDVTTSGGSSYVVRVTYADANGTIDSSTIGSDDISISGLGTPTASIVSGSDGASTVVDYTFTPPAAPGTPETTTPTPSAWAADR